MSLTASTTRDDFLFDSRALVPVSQARRPHSSGVLLELGSLVLMKPAMEHLIATVSQDALDRSEVWKIIVLMLLDSLVQLSGIEKQRCEKPDPDDLNPLYIYEAKMSLFMRMAQTRLGAERLLEAQLIPILSQCNYLDARPEADQSFMDQNSFLPSAIHRYHQLFMPALQLVDGMLATLGTKHATIPLILVEEMHLLVSLCAGVLTHVPKSELLSPHLGFGTIHAAVLALATTCVGSGCWLAAVQPQTDTEMFSASIFALGYGLDTEFDVNKRQKERMMCKCIIEDIGAASEFIESEITPVLSPITTTSRHEECGSHFLATIPTIADLSAELAACEHVSVENISELLPDADPVFLCGLDIPQKRALVCRELAQELSLRCTDDS
ncbi:hypothetical protein DFH08DRAFT_974109 [Mycena albidolilacea]|uniref:Uncharacterized protein n=1 Tax=Mycena albidolilacea TaxID=1033008 RepID=A0AAD7ECS5_9AGAR|nr:hypothetical protein DFH08DRAFT_974109 [Mycena albidolilacea]